MNQRQRKLTRRALWTMGFAVVVAAAVTAWNLNQERIRNLRYDGAVFSQISVSGDGRTLSAVASWVPCNEPMPQLAAHESADTVGLDFRMATPDLRHQCTGTMQQVSTVLRAPLGNRRLIDRLSGRKLNPFAAAQLVAPGYLPPGYTQTTYVYAERSGEFLLPEPDIRPSGAPPAWSRCFRKGSDGPTITIAQELKGARAINGPTTPVSVHGLPGRYAEAQGPGPERAIRWIDRGDTFTVLSTDPALAKTDLLKIADHLGR